MIRRTAQDIIQNWETTMANAGHQLMIKYGLPSAPDQAAIDRWVAEVLRQEAQGYRGEEGGRRAASRVFVGFETHKYASVADDIEALLDAAKGR